MVDPALMNFLQYAQAQQQMPTNLQMEMQNGQNMIPQQQMPTQQAASNPFDSGIRRAIDSARESLGMNQEQKDIALRKGLFGFANRMSQQPVQKGFWGNFGAIGQAIGQGVNDYDVASEQAMVQNNALANQILQYQNAERAQAAKAEQDAWKRQFAKDELAWKQQHMADQLAEQSRYHDIVGKRQAAGAGILGTSATNPFGDTFEPMQTRQEFSKAAIDKKGLGGALHDIEVLEEAYKDFRNYTKDNQFDPMGRGSSVINRGKDFYGKFADNKNLQAETTKRKAVKSLLNKFVSSNERALKGGVLGPTIIKMFKEQGIYPDIDNDLPGEFEAKFRNFKNEIENYYKAAELSSKYGIRIDPHQVEDALSMLNSIAQEQPTPQATGAPSMPDQDGIIFD